MIRVFNSASDISGYFVAFLSIDGFSFDRAERHDLKLQLWLFFSTFPFPPKKEGRRKGEREAKMVILSNAFLLDLFIPLKN